MQLSEQQLNMPVSQLSVKELIAIIHAASTGSINDDSLFNNEEWIISAASLADYIGVSKPTITRMIKDGTLEGSYIVKGHTYIFNRVKVKKMLEMSMNGHRKVNINA